MTGTLTVSIGLPGLPPVSLASNGATQISVSSGTGGFSEPVGVFGPATVPVSSLMFTGVPQISGLTLIGVGNGTKSVTGAGMGTGGLVGTAAINILQLFNLTIPLSVVGDDRTTVCGCGGITLTVVGQGWTAATAVVTGASITTPGTALVNTVTRVGSDNRTANHAGAITLVSGFLVITNVIGFRPGFAIQQLTFVPEAGTLLFLGSGVVCLVMYARTLRRR